MTKSKSTDIRTLKNLNQPIRYTIPDTKGLHLWVRSSDLKKYWVFRFTFNGKRQDMCLGSFPEITLAEARIRAQKLRVNLIHGINPAEEKKVKKARVKVPPPKITFKKFALDYIETMSPRWKNAKHSLQWGATLETYAFKSLGGMGLEDIKTPHILTVLNPIWNSKHETARRVMGRIERILSAAITTGLRTSANPAIWRGHLENVLPQRNAIQEHHAALPYSDLPAFMDRLSSVEGIAALALQFTILNASRTGEVLYAERCEVIGDVWTIPASRMKAKREHQVPLCPKALELIAKAQALDPTSKYIFSKKGKPLSSMAMLMLVRRLKTGITTHGFRSSFRDFVSEVGFNHSPEVAEMALAHTIGNKVEAAYRRGKLLERRRLLMLDWQDYCFKPKISA
jgi:integrase